MSVTIHHGDCREIIAKLDDNSIDAIGCELTDDYLPIIEGRVAWAQQEYDKAHDNLFGDAA